ncbi:MAG: hypothetical protein KGI50_06715 [Patescibacteria group bacterium]|nr:hypothetical protein [Patescibacteria group bacterium]
MNLKLDTNRIIGIYAPPDYGKTHLTKWLISKISPHVKVFIYDTNFEARSVYSTLNSNTFIVTSKKKSEIETPKFLNDAILKLRGTKSNFYLIIEDIDKLMDGGNKKRENSEIDKLSSDSRHQRIGMIYLTKEPVNIPVKLRSNTNLFFFGNFIEPAHVKTIGSIVDKTELKALKKPEFIMLDRTTNERTVVKLDGDNLVKVR